MTKDEALREASLADAPSIYTNEQGQAWANGYNDALESLAQPAQEPVAWMYQTEDENFKTNTLSVGYESTFNGKIIPLYTHSAPSWQGLSDDELSELFAKCGWVEEGDNLHTLGFYKHARMLEQALKEKNYR